MQAYLKGDRNAQLLFDTTLVGKKEELQRLVGDDHGLIDYLLDLFNTLSVPYKARLEFIRNLNVMAQVALEKERGTPVQRLIISKLRDETNRLSEYFA